MYLNEILSMEIIALPDISVNTADIKTKELANRSPASCYMYDWGYRFDRSFLKQREVV